MKPRSPIEMMVDQACGFDREAWEAGRAEREAKMIILRCPFCQKERKQNPDKKDPKGTKIVLCNCPQCVDVGHYCDTVYLDANGKSLTKS